MLDYAHQYAEQGHPVIPIAKGGKLPLARLVPNGKDDATLDYWTIEEWWSEEPNAGIGIRCDGLVVIDVDGQAGEQSLQALEHERGTLPETRTQRTGTGGHHLLYRVPDGVKIGNSPAGLGRPKGIDIRGTDRGYILVAPTVHPNGTPYRWENELPIMPAPGWLVTALTERPRSPTSDLPADPSSPYGLRALDLEAAAVRGTPEGGRNERLNEAAFALGQLEAGGELQPGLADTILLNAATEAGLPQQEAARTIQSGIQAGRQTPRSAPDNGIPTRTPRPTAPPAEPAANASPTENPPETAPTDTDARSRAIDGATFIMSEPEQIPACWGDGDQVLWAEGEGLMLVGPDGVGKTTLAQQLVLARIGITQKLLGQPVKPADRRVLYIAADRPRQAARSFARMVTQDHATILRDRLTVWKGPLPFDITTTPRALADLAEQLDATDIVIDSLKDVALDLSKDETGSRVNLALQEAIARGLQTCALHHQRKEQTQGGKPRRLADVYGSRWLTAGIGSVLCLWGDPGDALIELTHLKQPAEDIGPLQLIHNHTTGHTTIETGTTTLEILNEHAHTGLQVRTLAERLYKKTEPSRNEIEKARRTLETLLRNGKVHRTTNIHGQTIYKPQEPHSQPTP